MTAVHVSAPVNAIVGRLANEREKSRMLIFNPGTESRAGATLDNAAVIAGYILEDLKLPENIWTRDEAKDRDGWFCFILSHNGKSVQVDIPGADPDQVAKGRPFESRRLYVDGSSWMYGLALSIIADRLGLED